MPEESPQPPASPEARPALQVPPTPEWVAVTGVVVAAGLALIVGVLFANTMIVPMGVLPSSPAVRARSRHRSIQSSSLVSVTVGPAPFRSAPWMTPHRVGIIPKSGAHHTGPATSLGFEYLSGCRTPL